MHRGIKTQTQAARFLCWLPMLVLLWMPALPGFAQEAVPGKRDDTKKSLEVRILSPTANEFLAGEVRIACWATSPAGATIEKVEFYIDGALLFTDKEEPYTFSYEGSPDDYTAHSVKVVAYDSLGATAEHEIRTKAIEVEEFEEVFLVELFATVRDGKKRRISSLKKEDFTILEDGKEQEIAFFSTIIKPLSIAILIDTSGSMEEKIYKAQEAAVNFIHKTLGNKDQAMIVTFDTKVRRVQKLTSNRRKLEKAVLKSSTGGATVMFDAIAAATYELNQIDNSRRKAVILLSDGQDVGSVSARKRVIEYCKKSDIAIYAVGIDVETRAAPGMGPRPLGTKSTKARNDLLDFSKVTGGETFMIQDLDELKGVYDKIGKELRSQYDLAYYPENRRKDGKWRKIKVKIAEGKYKVRTRTGYYAPSE
ncbi:VWA domain-containing protein [Acidobacteriota bacterium]